MARYMVLGARRGMQVQWIAERAHDAADAVAQFHLANARCDPNPVASPIGPIPGAPDEPAPVAVSSPPEAAAVASSRADRAAPAGSPTPPKPIEPAPAGRKREPTADVPDAALPEPAPMEVGVLESYGVKPNDIAELYAAGLKTVEAVEEYGREHGGLTGVHGIGPVGEQQIRDGITAWRATSKI